MKPGEFSTKIALVSMHALFDDVDFTADHFHQVTDIFGHRDLVFQPLLSLVHFELINKDDVISLTKEMDLLYIE